MLFFEITPDNVEFASRLANAFVIGSAIVVAIAAWAQITVSEIKGRYADAKTAENERVAGEANKAAGEAILKSAELEKDAAAAGAKIAAAAERAANAERDGAEARKAQAEILSRAATAERDASQARALAASLEKETTVARADLARANERAASLELAANNARIEAARVRAAVVWRTISPSQRAALDAALRETTGRINVVWVLGDPEAQSLAMQITQGFEAARWEFMPIASQNNLWLQFGIVLDDRSADAAPIRQALVAADIEFRDDALPAEFGLTQGAQIKGAPVLFVGSRPVFVPMSQP
ncbi:MAG: hypothetical protein ABL957_06295 [Parvularculaceae bacterium]